MNYYGPRQRERDKRWDYTQMRDKQIWPIGYCVEFKEWEPYQLFVPIQNEQLKRQWEIEVLPNKNKYHTTGHTTREEACICYREYLLDQRLKLNAGEIQKDTLRRCQADPPCSSFTRSYAELDMRMFLLCDEHRTREMIEHLIPTIGDSISSY